MSGTGAPVRGCRLGGARTPATQLGTPHHQPPAKASAPSIPRDPPSPRMRRSALQVGFLTDRWGDQEEVTA